ncbi:MAG: 3-phosphoshikimate 1-carboxyvinyltransferase [Taibaiella sp.]|jgi:3-phosphoshikimate 1-carboxyvinyltransferase
MEVIINPATIKGTVFAPASKSVMQRACAAALLRNGETVIHNYGRSEDDKAAINIIQQLGAEIIYINDRSLKIISNGKVEVKTGAVLDCGESGLSLRMFTPIAALSDQEISILAKGSLAKRPGHFFEEVLPQLNVALLSPSGTFPIRIKGPLKPENIQLDGSVTSQFLTGLLFAFSVAAELEVSIETTSLKSKPYIDLTLKVMEEFKMKLPAHKNYNEFHFKKEERSEDKKVLEYTIEGDWSNAAFLLVAGAIAGNVTIKGLDVFTAQGDKKILEALQDCGCRLSIQAEQIEVTNQPLKAFHFDATDCPDLFPPLAVLAACCSGTSVIEGVHRLAYKESNRAETLQQEFAKLGVVIDIQDDKMIIKGGSKINAAALHSHNDHRIAMAGAVLALKAEGDVTIDGSEAVNKSYPDFYHDLAKLCDNKLR